MAREHDRELMAVAQAAAGGNSGIAVLVGGSSTGKTRACWEALGQLREQPEGWRLWHPIDPSRPDAALRELPSIGQRTVIWLNEAQFYLDAAVGGLGERIAAGLRELLRDKDRAPVLVLATLWPEYWYALTVRPPAGTDPHAQARELLAGRDISVPSAFTADQLRQLPAVGDPRLARAAEAAEDGQVIQFLAGAPELMARYRNAPPAAAALIRAAIDARRLGMGIALPLAFLEQAAPGYLSDTEWDTLGEDWLGQALAYTAAPCNGVRGLLARIRPRPARNGNPASGSVYRLADYLEQHGRSTHRARIPPVDFWDAAARFAVPAELPALAAAAENRGLLRDAARLRRQAAAQGDASQAVRFLQNWYSLRPHSPDPIPAQWTVSHVALNNPDAAASLLGVLREAGADTQAAALLARAPAAHAALDDPGAVARLLHALRAAGAKSQAAILADRAAAHVALDNPRAVAWLLRSLRAAGAKSQAAILADRAAAQAPLDNPGTVATLLKALLPTQAAALLARAPTAHAALDDLGPAVYLMNTLREAGASTQAAILADRAAAHVALDDPGTVALLLNALRDAGAKKQAAVLLARTPAAHAAVNDPGAVAALLYSLREAGAKSQAAILADRAAAHAALDDLRAFAGMLGVLRAAGANSQAAALIARAPAAHAALDDPGAVALLLRTLREAGVKSQAAILADRAAAHAPLDKPGTVATLLKALLPTQAAALLARAPAAHVALDDPGAVAQLLGALREAGAKSQAAILAGRAAAHVALDDPGAVAQLLHALREAGAKSQAAILAGRAAAHAALDKLGAVKELLDAVRRTGGEERARTLVDRLPAEGHFDLFGRQPGHEMRYRFGRELDGSPAPSWGWGDLD